MHLCQGEDREGGGAACPRELLEGEAGCPGGRDCAQAEAHRAGGKLDQLGSQALMAMT